MQRTDAAHAVMVGKQCRHVGEAAAVSRIHYKDQSQYKHHQKHVALSVLDTARQHYQTGKDDGKHEDQLIDGIPVFHGIRPCGEAETTACIEDRGNRRDHAHGTCQADTFHDHLLL